MLCEITVGSLTHTIVKSKECQLIDEQKSEGICPVENNHEKILSCLPVCEEAVVAEA